MGVSLVYRSDKATLPSQGPRRELAKKKKIFDGLTINENDQYSQQEHKVTKGI